MPKRPRLRDFFAGHKTAPPRKPSYDTQDLLDMALEDEDAESLVDRAFLEANRHIQKNRNEIEDVEK